jgi:hypothetical protein
MVMSASFAPSARLSSTCTSTLARRAVSEGLASASTTWSAVSTTRSVFASFTTTWYGSMRMSLNSSPTGECAWLLTDQLSPERLSSA